MPKVTHKILVLLLAFASALPAIAQDGGRQTIVAKADSTVLLMGDRVAINIEVLKNSTGGHLVTDRLVPDQNYYGIDFLDYTADSILVGNGRMQVNYHLNFQAFAPADLVAIPPFAYCTEEGDTLWSNSLALKVYPVELSPELGKLEAPEDVAKLIVHPDQPPIDVNLRWYDYIPNWWIWVLLGLLVVALGIVALFLFKKNGPKLFVARPQPTPYEIAERRLGELRRRRLIEQGQPKMFYTELVDILRLYLEGRFGIKALEMPSREIMRKIREHKEIHLSSSQLEDLLSLADFVKFAAANPDPGEGQRAFNTVADFVHATKPVEAPATGKIANKRKKK